jgi:hypothetical protein
MSAYAIVCRALGATGHRIDRAESPYLARVRDAGIEPAIGHARRTSRRRRRRGRRLDRHPADNPERARPASAACASSAAPTCSPS